MLVNMALEDFFTLTEMKNGLTTLLRVEEMVSTLQRQKNCGISNVGDAARQWSAVADTLAATENKDCLVHFVNLNGICFLNQWLQEAVRCSNDVHDSALKELINALLTSLEKIPVDKEKLASSEIMKTVEQLLDQKGISVCERARLLLDKWNHFDNGEDMEKDLGCKDNQPKPPVAANTVESNQSVYSAPNDSSITARGKEGTSVGSAGVESQNSIVTRGSGGLQFDTLDEKKSVLNRMGTITSVYSTGAVGDVNSLSSSLVSSSCLENLSSPDEPSVFPTGGPSFSGRGNSTSRERDAVDQFDDLVVKDDDAIEMASEVCKKEGSPCIASQIESCDASTSSSMECKASAAIKKELDSEGKSTVTEALGVRTTGSPKRDMSKMISEMDHKPDIGPGCKETDALEVPQQAVELVKSEVVNCREPFCSSSPEVSSGAIKGTSSPDSIEGKQEQPVIEEQNQIESPTIYSPKAQSSRTSENVDKNYENCGQDLELPELAAADREPVGTLDRMRCDFDLNQDASSEEFEGSMDPSTTNQVGLSTPIAVVAGLKGALDLPVAPLHFDGEIGWRGSAVTSAFRRASPRRTPDGDKASHAPIRRSSFIEIDLNAADDLGDVPLNPIPAVQLPVSSCYPSRDSSLEVSSKRVDKLQLDLNCDGNEDVVQHPTSLWRPRLYNWDQGPAHASSSSSKQHSMRDFDLNDDPSFVEAHDSINFCKSSSKARCGSSKGDPAIMIMGSRMAMEKDYINQDQQHSFLPSGHGVDSVLAARPIAPFSHPLPFGYGGVASWPAFYGPEGAYGPGNVACMVDSKGATVIPQVLSSATMNGPLDRPAFFTTSVTSASLSADGVGSSKSGFDLNSGMTSVGSGASNQFFVHGLAGFTEQQAMPASQAATSGSLKRKEPDCSWDLHPRGHKPMKSWL